MAHRVTSGSSGDDRSLWHACPVPSLSACLPRRPRTGRTVLTADIYNDKLGTLQTEDFIRFLGFALRYQMATFLAKEKGLEGWESHLGTHFGIAAVNSRQLLTRVRTRLHFPTHSGVCPDIPSHSGWRTGTGSLCPATAQEPCLPSGAAPAAYYRGWEDTGLSPFQLSIRY